MAGVEPGALDKPYFSKPILRVVRKRIGWLLLLFVVSTPTCAVLHRFVELAAGSRSRFHSAADWYRGKCRSSNVMTVIRSLRSAKLAQHAWRVGS